MDLRIIAVPYDTAIRDWRMGAGPDRLLNRGLEDHLRAAGHRVAIERIELPPDEPTSEISTAFELAARLRDRVHAARSAGELPIILAGNCGTALGSVQVAVRSQPDHGRVGVRQRGEGAPRPRAAASWTGWRSRSQPAAAGLASPARFPASAPSPTSA